MLAAASLLIYSATEAQRNRTLHFTGQAGHASAAHHHPPNTRGGGAPANDGCGSVTPVALEVGSPLTFTGTTVGATVTGDYEEGSELDGFPAVVWHAFTTTTCGMITVNYCGTSPAFTNTAGFLSAFCPAGSNYIPYSTDPDCGDGNFMITYNSIPPGTYYLPVWSDPANDYGPYTIAVSIEACPPGYCIPNISNTSEGDFIAGVYLGDINNATDGATSYSDYTALSTDMAQGQDYTVSITGGDYSPDAYAAWIDYNNDGSFSSDEKLGQASTIEEGQVVTIPFMVPEDAWVGTARMRVRCAYASFPMDPCIDYEFGETEDYSVNVFLGNNGVAENAAMRFAVMPNPSDGNFQIRALSAGNTKIELMDLTGRVVYAEQALLVAGALHTISLQGELETGTYALRLTGTKGSSTSAIVVQ